MDDVHAGDSWAAGVASSATGATSPPLRPAVPPKPNSKVNFSVSTDSAKRNSSTDASISPIMQTHKPVPSVPISHNFRSPSAAKSSTDAQSLSQGHISPKSPNPVLSPGGSVSARPNKPALPPKPVVSPSVLSSPPLTKFPTNGKTPPKFPVENTNSVNKSNVSPPLPPVTVTNGSTELNGNIHSPPPFLRAKPPHPPPPLSLSGRASVTGEPVLSPRITSPQNSRPNSSAFFNFSSPIQNLNSANFPSTSAGLNQVGGGPHPPTSPQKLSEIRVKSASLGRNITFPFSTPSTTSAAPSSGVSGFFARKSATLTRFLPLDLQLGNSKSSPPNPAPVVTSPSKPKPNTFSLNPFIVQQKQQQQKQSTSQMSQANPPLNFGKSIAFASPDSPLPPPPPPRLKKKLSPVNSVGSPSSPTSPFPIGHSTSFTLPPTSPLPPPPPISPANASVGGAGHKKMEAVHESAEDVMAIYAEVNKEKKWAERKQKQEEITRKLSLDSSLPLHQRQPPAQAVNLTIVSTCTTNPAKMSESSQNSNINSNKEAVSQLICDPDNPLNNTAREKEDNDKILATDKEDSVGTSSSANEAETVVVKSWLRSHMLNGNEAVVATDTTTTTNSNSNLSPKNPFRSVSPTYQSVKTGHIYETIGDHIVDDGLNNNIKNTNNNRSSNGTNCNNLQNAAIEIQETSEVIRAENDLCENQSFLFKLVINPKKVTDAEQATEATKNESSLLLNDEQINAENLSKNAASSAKLPLIACSDEKSVSGSILVVDELDTVAVVQPSKSDTTHEQETAAQIADAIMALKPTTEISSSPHLANEEVCEKHGSASTTYLIPTVVQDFRTDEEKFLHSNSSFQSTATECSTTTLGSSIGTPPNRSKSILRRRSWNCDRVDSPSPSESSSTTSSVTNLPYQQRDRIFTVGGSGRVTNRDSLILRESDWVDEGELSNGALADAESSDVQLRSSAEDVTFRKTVLSAASSQSSTRFSSRRLVSSIFSSFGKGSFSSSGSSGGANTRKSGAGMRSGKRKDKAVSHFGGPMDNSLKYQRNNGEAGGGLAKLGRQISDSVIPTTMISGPILANSVSFDSGLVPQKPQVQFAPEIPETRIIHHSQQDSSQSGLLTSPLSALSIEEGVVLRDDESVSSSESVSGCGSASGSVSGYEDILADLSPKEKKSFYVAREILTSERTFVDVLNLITVDFPRFVENSRRYHGQLVISKEDLEKMLGGLPNLKQVNENLLSDLEERVAHWKENPKIADILVKKGPFLKLYATYIKDFQRNSMHLDTCCQRYPLFAEVVREFESGERCQKLGLKHYMLKPVQRMPQYRLLLEDYLKSLDKEQSNDYDDTVKGITIVKDVAEHANEAIRLQVNAEKLLHLQNRLSTGMIILKADRQLLKEGELMKVCRKVLQPRFFALMNDCLLCFNYHAAAGSPKDLKLRNELPLAGMRVSLSPAEDYQNEFSVISVTRSFNLVAKSTRERDDWMKALNTAIHDNIKKRTCSTPDEEIGFSLGKEAPVWIQDSRVTMCQLCTAEFTVTFRRHHCRACGKVVCGNCSSGSAPLQYLDYKATRVCDSCYEYLLDEFDKLEDEDVDPNINARRHSIRDRFKKVTPNVSKGASKLKRMVPARLEVHANSSGSRISGYLTWREKEKKSWKRRWFVLIDRVLYVYAASEDIVAIKSIPLLGWQVEMDKPDPQHPHEHEDSQFRLTHMGQHPILFQADSSSTAEKWVAAMSEAVVLS